MRRFMVLVTVVLLMTAMLAMSAAPALAYPPLSGAPRATPTVAIAMARPSPRWYASRRLSPHRLSGGTAGSAGSSTRLPQACCRYLVQGRGPSTGLRPSLLL
jgi:hypothetical protein